MDNKQAFLATLLLLGLIFSATSRLSYSKNGLSGELSETAIANALASGKKAAIIFCLDERGCEYMTRPMEELAGEMQGELVLYEVDANAYCPLNPSMCPKQAPALIIYSGQTGTVFYGDVPKEWMKEYLSGYRSAK